MILTGNIIISFTEAVIPSVKYSWALFCPFQVAPNRVNSAKKKLVSAAENTVHTNHIVECLEPE